MKRNIFLALLRKSDFYIEKNTINLGMIDGT